MGRTITIAGGGLAGLSLGLLLRGRDVPVKVVEAGSYPRHRVCGEFISGRGQDVLRAMGCLEDLQHGLACLARTALFVSGANAGPVRRLPQAALCVSRYVLDDFLGKRFRAAGGELLERTRLDDFGEGVVRATGRRRKPRPGSEAWFGWKAHVHNVTLQADLEMHATANGYLGLCRLPDGEVNVCGLFSRKAHHSHPEAQRGRASVPAFILGGLEPGPLREQLAQADVDGESVCAVAGLDLHRTTARASRECRVGDAITMIAPVSGNGMSMALESAALAAQPLTDYSRGALTWEQTQSEIASKEDATFGKRLAWASLLQGLMLGRAGRGWIMRLLLHSETAWRLFFATTR